VSPWKVSVKFSHHMQAPSPSWRKVHSEKQVLLNFNESPGWSG
jgi:hypothetical protein